MKHSLQLKLSQHLTLTPQLQQSIRLLQLSTVELNQELERYLAENPLLERADLAPDEASAPREAGAQSEAQASEAQSPSEDAERAESAEHPERTEHPTDDWGASSWRTKAPCFSTRWGT